MEEEKQNSAHVQVSVQLEDSDKKYNIRFTEEVDFIIKLFQNNTPYRSQIFENFDILTKMSFYEYYTDNNVFESIKNEIAKQHTARRKQSDRLHLKHEKWYIIVFFLFTLYSEKKELKGIQKKRRYEVCGQWLNDSQNPYYEKIPKFLSILKDFDLKNIDIFDSSIKDLFRDEQCYNLWIDDVTIGLLHFCIENFSITSFVASYDRNNISAFNTYLQKFLMDNNIIDIYEDNFFNNISGKTKENYVKIKTDILLIQIQIIKVQTKSILERLINSKYDNENQRLRLELHENKIYDLLKAEDVSSKARIKMLHELEDLGEQRNELLEKYEQMNSEFDATSKLEHLLSRILLTKQLLFNTDKLLPLPMVERINDQKKGEYKQKLDSNITKMRGVIDNEEKQKQTEEAAKMDYETEHIESKITSPMITSTSLPKSDLEQYNDLLEKFIFTFQKDEDIITKSDSVVSGYLNFKKYAINWKGVGLKYIQNRSSKFVVGIGPDKKIIQHFRFFENKILPETVQSTYEDNILYYQNEEYHVFCGKVYKRGEDNEFSLITDDITLTKNCREFNILQSNSQEYKGYVYHTDLWYNGKVFWLPDNSQRYFNGTRWMTVKFRPIYIDLIHPIKYYLGDNNQLYKTKTVKVEPNTTVINCESNELCYTNTEHEVKFIIDRDEDHVNLSDNKIKPIELIVCHSNWNTYNYRMVDGKIFSRTDMNKLVQINIKKINKYDYFEVGLLNSQYGLYFRLSDDQQIFFVRIMVYM